jgi:branched-chain amino acid transport system substrate-binding protein
MLETRHPSGERRPGSRSRRFVPVWLVAVGAGLILGASAFAGSDRAGLGRELAKGTIHVTALEPSRGYFVEHNNLLTNGIVVAVDEMNAHGGIGGKVRIDLTRARFSPTARAGDVIRETTAGAQVVILPCNVDLAAGLAKAAAEKHLLILSPCNPDPKQSQQVPMDWPIAMGGNQEAAGLVDWAAQQGWRTAYILTTDPTFDYVTSLTHYLRAAMKLSRIQVVGQGTMKLDGRNFNAVIDDIEHSHAESIFTASFSPYIERFVAAMRDRNIHLYTFATDGMDADIAFSHYTEKQVANVLFASFGFARPDSKQFFDDYLTRYGKKPVGSFAALGLETVRVLSAAVLKASSTQPQAISDAFAHGFTLEGVGLSARTYQGHGVREPVTDVGLARIDPGEPSYYPFYASTPSPIPPP